MASTISTISYWNDRYRSGGNSGAGSYGHLARYKAGFLNRFVAVNRLQRIGELGCGDGSQLSRAMYPEYVGYDVSSNIIKLCKEKFAGDTTKRFYLLDDVGSLEEVDLSLSLDVLYHLLENDTYDEYLGQLFRMAAKFVIIYANGCVRQYDAAHVRLHDFTKDIKLMFPDWTLVNCERNPYYSEIGTDPNSSWSNFYVYEAPTKARHPVLYQNHYSTTKKINTSLAAQIMTAHEFRNRTIEEWRSVTENKGVQFVSIDQELQWNDVVTSPGVKFSYVTEILPELKRDGSPEISDNCIGVTNPSPLLIVSITSIKARLETLYQVLLSIINQSRIPDKIILNVSAEPYLLDEGIPRNAIPAPILHLEAAGLVNINYVENTGPYRKLLPTLKEHWQTNCVIVTADDDTIYPPFWLDELYSTYLANGNCVIARRVVLMAIKDRKPLPYLEWANAAMSDEIPEENIDFFMVPTGKDGVLYHPKFFTDAIFDPEVVRLCPTSDDIALKLITMSTRTRVRTVSKRLSSSGRHDEYPMIQENKCGLWNMHNLQGKNDKHLTSLLSYFSEKGLFNLEDFLVPVKVWSHNH